jgi:hypothetical protein
MKNCDSSILTTTRLVSPGATRPTRFLAIPETSPPVVSQQHMLVMSCTCVVRSHFPMNDLIG